MDGTLCLGGALRCSSPIPCLSDVPCSVTARCACVHGVPVRAWLWRASGCACLLVVHIVLSWSACCGQAGLVWVCPWSGLGWVSDRRGAHGA